MKPTDAVAIALGIVLMATAANAGPAPRVEIQAPRGQDVQAPRG